MRTNHTDHWSKLKSKVWHTCGCTMSPAFFPQDMYLCVSLQSYYLTQIPTGHYISYCRLQGYGELRICIYDDYDMLCILLDSHGNKYTRRPFEMPTYHTVNPYGNLYSHHSAQHLCGATDQAGARGNRKNKPRNTLALVGCPELSHQLSEFGTLQLPTPYQWLTGTGQAKPRRVPSASSCRAKQGFKYWPHEKPQSSKLRDLLSVHWQLYADFALFLGSNSKRTVGSSGTFLGIGVPRL